MPKLFWNFFRIFFSKNFFTKIFFEFFFFEKFFLRKLFSTNCFLVKIFIIEFFLAKIVFTIFSRMSFVFDVCEIMYVAKNFIRNFAFREYFCFKILVYGKKIVNFFCDFFFNDEREYQIWKCFFSEKSKIFSDHTLKFLYLLIIAYYLPNRQKIYHIKSKL